MSNNKLINNIIAVFVVVILTTILTTSSIHINAQEKEKYPYMFFASSEGENSIHIDGDNICINGDIATKGKIKISEGYNQSGKIVENSKDNMIYIFDKIDREYFDSASTDCYDNNCLIEEQNICIEKTTEVRGEVTLAGNVTLSSALKALDNVIITGEVNNSSNSIIYSKYGDIFINSKNVNISGLIYAPFGDVQITAQNICLNSVIIIAKRIVIIGSSVNVSSNDNIAIKIGNTSEEVCIPDDEQKYIEDKELEEDVTTEQKQTETTTDMPTETTTEDTTEYTAENTTEKITESSTESHYNMDEEYVRLVSDFDNWSQYTDSDSDGLPDDFEDIIGSDKHKIDTDGDALDDYYEYIILGSSVLSNDTDNNGITDEKEDFDDDCLSNIEEYKMGTMPWEDDTDKDGLCDGDEQYNFGTSPLMKDTDSDGLLDGEDVLLGLNPLKVDTDDDGVEDSREQMEQEVVYDAKKHDVNSAIRKVIIETKTSGYINSRSKIEPINSQDSCCADIPGIFGTPYEIDIDCEFESAKLSFVIDENQLRDIKLSDLKILWYDEKQEEFRELKTECDMNTYTLSTQTTHFSKYMVVDENKWIQAWEKAFDYVNSISQESTTYYTSIIFDLSIPRELRNKAGNTSEIFGYQLTEYHKEYIAICKIIGDALGNMIGQNDKICVSGQFRNYGYVAEDIATKIQLINKINELEIWCKMGWCLSYDDDGNEGFSYGSLNYAMSYPNKFQDNGNIEKRIIYISGCNTDIPQYLISNAKRDNVKIYTLGIGQYVKSVPLIEMSDYTDGKYCKINNILDIEDAMESLNCDISSMKDSDCDGIPDVMEIEGIRNQYGITINTNPYNPDTDGDGLLDGEEMDISIQNKKTVVDVWGNIFDNIPDGAIYYNMKSNPTIIDTDNDGYTDYEEIITYHTNARYSDVKIYKLKNDYIRVGEEKSYGGNQGWLGDEFSSINKNGCGVISACDILLYLTNSFDYKDGLANEVVLDDDYYNKQYYIKYAVTMNNQFLPMGKKGLWGTTMALGVSRYFKQIGVKMKAIWKMTDNDFLEDVEEMLEQNIPVSMSANDIKQGYGDECKIKMYQPIDENIWWIKDKMVAIKQFHSHYVTITAVSEDNISGKKWFQVSSWGNKYYIDYDEYSTYAEQYGQWGWITTNILRIERKN